MFTPHLRLLRAATSLRLPARAFSESPLTLVSQSS